MKVKLSLVLMSLYCVVSAQITKVGNDTLLDIACWNVEWFGDVTNGPSNEQLQYTNVRNLITQTDIDIWGLVEISDIPTFYSLVSGLQSYDGVHSGFSQTQKMALVWKKSKFRMLSYGDVLTESDYYYDLAGRPPLEVVLVTTDHKVKNDTLYFYVVHLKANSGNGDQTSYNRRKNATAIFKTFLDTNRKGQKCIVLGDWNDDMDQSVVFVGSEYLATPFANFVNDSTHYFCPTLALSRAGENSYVSNQNMIDHQMISRSLKDSFYLEGSALVMKQTAAQITGYANNTSDHYPILTRYHFNRHIPTPSTGLPTVMPKTVKVYPNPASGNLFVELSEPAITACLYGMDGRMVQVEMSAQNKIDITQVPGGLYQLVVNTGSGIVVATCLIEQ